MKITITQANGESYARVTDGDLVVYVTAEYFTERMALADAKCWAAFHGGEMTEGLVKPGDSFAARSKGDHRMMLVTADEMQRRIDNAAEFGVQVDARTINGYEYIEIHNGAGSSYGKYRRVCSCPDTVGELCSDNCKHRKPWGTGASLHESLTA